MSSFHGKLDTKNTIRYSGYPDSHRIGRRCSQMARHSYHRYVSVLSHTPAAAPWRFPRAYCRSLPASHNYAPFLTSLPPPPLPRPPCAHHFLPGSADCHNNSFSGNPSCFKYSALICCVFSFSFSFIFGFHLLSGYFSNIEIYISCQLRSKSLPSCVNRIISTASSGYPTTQSTVIGFSAENPYCSASSTAFLSRSS